MKRRIILLFVAIALAFCTLGGVGCGKKDENVNLVIQVEFSDTETHFSHVDNSVLAQAFNGANNSLDNFIYVNSNGNRTLKSKILGVVKISKPIDYFMPRYRFENGEYKEVNEKGYDNRYFDESGNPAKEGKQSVERFYREQELVRLTTENAKDLTKKLGRKPKFENLTIVPSRLNRYVYNGDIFHPHQGKSFSGEESILSTSYYTEGVSGQLKTSKIRKTEVGSYVIIPYAYINDGEKVSVTTLCHEYMHVLGLPDLYPYDSDGAKKPVGEFDVLGGETTLTPTQSLSYVKYKMGWLKEGKDILPVTGSGEYDLTAVEDAGGVKAYKITLGDYYEKGDVFYLEYRKLGTVGSSSKPTEGVIIYRVNETNGYITKSGETANTWRGNMYGDYEVIVFRNPQDLFLGKHATICEEDGYTSFGNPDGDVNVIFNSDGTNSGIKVTYQGKNTDGTVKVKIELPEENVVVPREKSGLKSEVGNRHVFYFDRVEKDVTAYIFYSSKPIKKPTVEKLLKSKIPSKKYRDCLLHFIYIQ